VSTGPSEAAARQRLDKWLWFARLVKTRTGAQRLVAEGGVRVNRAKVANPAQPLKPGDVLTVTLPGEVRVLRVLGVGARRGPPAEARQLYEDLAPRPAAAGKDFSESGD
jgi:ribosome-associated heat shock protein Hsp15